MRIFVSYRSVNRALVNQLVDDLVDMGHDVWYDQELQGGQTWWDMILERLRWCDLLVFALTPQSVESYPCQLEYTYANKLKKTILPVQILDGVSYKLLPVLLQERQIVMYVERDIEAYKKLAAAIRALPPTHPLPDPLPDPPAVPISPLAPLKEIIDTPTLEFEQQVAVLHHLKGYLGNPEYDGDARLLLERLSQHAMLRASVLREIEAALKTPSVSRHTAEVPEFDPFADLVPPITTSSAPPANRVPVGMGGTTSPPPSADPFAMPEPAASARPDADEIEILFTPAPDETIYKRYRATFTGYGTAGLVSGLYTYGITTVATALARNASKQDIVLTDRRLVILPKVVGEDEVSLPYAQIAALERVGKALDPAIRIVTADQQEYTFSLIAWGGFGYGDRKEFVNAVRALALKIGVRIP